MLSKNKRVIKYLAVGLTAFVTDYFLFIALTEHTSSTVFFSNTTALLVGFLISFFGNKLFVFKKNKDSKMNYTLGYQLLLYAVLLTINAGLSYLLIASLEKIGITIALGKIVSMAFIVIWNYILYKKVIFKQS